MKINSIKELYQEDIMDNIGVIFYFAEYYKLDLEQFYNLYLDSNVCKGIELNNPYYMGGAYGLDFFNEICNKCYDNVSVLYNEYYWTGYVIGYLICKLDCSFKYLNKILPINTILKMYNPYHEASLDKIYDIFLEKVKDSESNLKRLRLKLDLSQSKLSNLSGVDIRSIQLYEQHYNDINKAQVLTLYKLAKVLNCQIEDLIEC